MSDLLGAPITIPTLPGLAAVTTLGVRTVYDLRPEAERSADPDRVPAGTAHVVVDVLADMKPALPDLFDDPVRTTESPGNGRAAELLAQAYRDVIGLPSALRGYRVLYTGLADADQRPRAATDVRPLRRRRRRYRTAAPLRGTRRPRATPPTVSASTPPGGTPRARPSSSDRGSTRRGWLAPVPVM